jgi:hypothetical protein
METPTKAVPPVPLSRLVRRLIGNVLWQPIAALNWTVDRLYYRRRLMWLYDPKYSPLRLLHKALVKVWSPFYVRDWGQTRDDSSAERSSPLTAMKLESIGDAKEPPNGGSVRRLVLRWPLWAIPAVVAVWHLAGDVWPVPLLLAALWEKERNRP